MNHVFTLGLECRLLPASSHAQDGETISIPPHWTTIAVFGGVDSRGVPRMWSTMPGIVGRDSSMESARAALNNTLRHFPIDGGSLRVRDGRVFSAAINDSSPLKQYHLWVPPKDVFWAGPNVPVIVDGQVMGGGIGLEWDVRTRMLHLVPYLAATVVEEHDDGRKTAVVVPVRWMTPGDPKSVLEKGDAPLSEIVPKLHAQLRSRAGIGSRVTLEILAEPTPHYSLLEVHADTTMGAAFKEAGLSAVDPDILSAVRDGQEMAEA
jgi:hypothetical protein